MTTTFQILKRGLLAGALLMVGFGAGWISAILFGGRLPLESSLTAYLGPGLIANRATPNDLRDQFTVFWEVWNLVESEFYHRTPLDRQRMIQGAIRGMLESLGDQYTVYQEPDLAAQTQDHMQGKLGGIGTYLRITDGKAFLYKPIKNAPATRAGLQQDDEIVAIDDAPIEPLIAGLDANQATVKVAAKLRGQSGTTVKLSIRRAGQAPFDVLLTRADIVIPSVNSQLLNDNLAYIQITEFKATTTTEFDTALRELLLRKPKGIILDLRNNPGGFLLNAQEVLGRLSDGVALYEDKNTADLTELRAIVGSSDIRDFTTPLVVLVNNGSASASEIVAGALRDTRKATYLMGEKTFGKGSVQNIHTLSDGGSARITIAHWLTPNKSEIHKLGITPQFVVPYTEDLNSQVPCVGDRQPTQGQTTCADSQLAGAIKLLSDGQAPPPTVAPAAAK